MSWRQRRYLRRILGTAALAFCIGLVGAGSAMAEKQKGCPAPTLVQPFLPWGDPGSYFLAPGGSFEGSPAGWTLNGKAAVTPGNESYYVNVTADGRSLSLPAGSSATSPSICVGLTSPDMRLFVRNSGSDSAALRIDLNYTSQENNKPATTTIATLRSGSDWMPISQIFFLDLIQPVLQNGNTTVSFTFTPLGDGGNWQIDDFYIDPLKSQNGFSWG
jgi:hypothetical protein